MACDSFVQELSQALGKSDVNNSDTFGVVDQNTLYRVKISDLALSLGVTGEIASLNAGSATPILVGQAPSYQIRGIVGGPGAVAIVTPENTVQIKTQLQNLGTAADGASVIQNTQADTIGFRRIKAGRGVEITQESDRITIDNTEVAVSNNTQIISELSDFPEPVGGVIRLVDDTDYLIVNNISTSNRFIIGTSTIVRSVDPNINTLTYTGTGAMFTASEGNFSIKEISLDLPNALLFDHAGTTTGAMALRWVRIFNCLGIGDISKPVNGIYNNFWVNVSGPQGIAVNNQNGIRLVISESILFSATDPVFCFIDLDGSTFDSFSASSIEILNTIPTQTFLKGLPASGNLNPDTYGFVNQLTINGGMQGLQGIVYGDPGWEFLQADTIPTTLPAALATLDATAVTVIPAQNVPTVIVGSFTDHVSDYLTINGNGRITYNGRRPRELAVDVSITGRPLTGTQTFTISLGLNGVSIPDSGVTQEIASGAVESLTLTWLLMLDSDDFIEIFVANDTSAQNFEAQKITFRVR